MKIIQFREIFTAVCRRAAGTPGLERKPEFWHSARAFQYDAAGFQRSLSHARNEAPNSGNARSGRNDGARKCRVKKKRNVGSNDSDSIPPRYSRAFFRLAPSRASDLRAPAINHGLVSTSANPLRHSGRSLRRGEKLLYPGSAVFHSGALTATRSFPNTRGAAPPWKTALPIPTGFGSGRKPLSAQIGNFPGGLVLRSANSWSVFRAKREEYRTNGTNRTNRTNRTNSWPIL